MSNHMQRIHISTKVPTIHNCNLCEKTFSYISNLERHIKISHMNNKDEKDQKFKCELCSKEFRGKNGLDLHVKEKHEEKNRLTCGVCKETFVRRYSLKTHLFNKHLNGKRLFDCEFCDRSFKSKNVLSNHKRNLHGGPSTQQFLKQNGEEGYKDDSKNEIIVYECSLCKSRFKNHKALKAHNKRVHERILKHKCKDCENHL